MVQKLNRVWVLDVALKEALEIASLERFCPGNKNKVRHAKIVTLCETQIKGMSSLDRHRFKFLKQR